MLLASACLHFVDKMDKAFSIASNATTQEASLKDVGRDPLGVGGREAKASPSAMPTRPQKLTLLASASRNPLGVGGLIHDIKNAIFTNHCTNWGRGFDGHPLHCFKILI